jgi:hypothetical protein
VVRVGTSKGSTISLMAAVHPGHELPGPYRKKKKKKKKHRY